MSGSSRAKRITSGCPENKEILILFRFCLIFKSKSSNNSAMKHFLHVGNFQGNSETEKGLNV